MSKVTFGMIVRDGMPFIKYSIEAVRPLAHEIRIIVDARSTDGTLEFVYDLINKHNEDGKLYGVIGEWDDKTAQSNEYLRDATGDWVWQLDSDEIYCRADIARALELLDLSKEDNLNIPILNFWKNLNTVVVDGMWDTPPVRIHRHYKGDEFIGHRPPLIRRQNGQIIQRTNSVLPYITMYHYSYLGDERVRRKSEYFAENMKSHPVYGRYLEWYKQVWQDPVRVTKLHITGAGRAIRFDGEHPEVIQEALKRGELKEYL